jgi:hypothetical protein
MAMKTNIPFIKDADETQTKAYLASVWEIVRPLLGDVEFTHGIVSSYGSDGTFIYISVMRTECLKNLETKAMMEAMGYTGKWCGPELPRHSSALIIPFADSFRLVPMNDHFRGDDEVVGLEQPDCFERIAAFCERLPRGIWTEQRGIEQWDDQLVLPYYYELIEEVDRWLKRSRAKSQLKTRRGTRT